MADRKIGKLVGAPSGSGNRASVATAPVDPLTPVSQPGRFRSWYQQHTIGFLTAVSLAGVRSTSDLKGINFAVNAPGNSLDWVAASIVMHKLGYSPSQYSFVTSGSPATQEAALANGVVDASINFPPGSTLTVQKGANILLTVASEPYGKAMRASAPIIADPAWYDAHRTAAMGFFKGMVEAMNFVYQPNNKAAVVADIAKIEGISTALATDTYNFFVIDINAVSHDPAPTLEELENSLRDDQQAGLRGLPAPTAKALSGDYDDSLANAAEKTMSGR